MGEKWAVHQGAKYVSIVPCATTFFPNNVIACFGQELTQR